MRSPPAAWRTLLRLLPRWFRDEYGAEMSVVVAEHWADARTGAGALRRLRFWFLQTWAVVRLAAQLRLRGRGGHAWTGIAPAARRGGVMAGLSKDAVYAWRSFRKHPGFAAITVLTLGLGIGASTTIFSAVQAVLFRDLPYEDAERVAVVFQADEDASRRSMDGVSAANVADLRDGSDRLMAAATAEPFSLDLQLEDRAESLRTWAVSEGFFEAIGGRAILGRTFTPDEYVAGNQKVVVLGHRSWTQRFGADPSIVGSEVTLDGEPYVVVGVLPPEFRFPDRAELWIPRPPAERDSQDRAADFMTGIARIAPGVTMEQAQADADRIASSLAELYPQTNRSTGLTLVPLREHLFGDVRAPLLVLFGSVGFVLLIACANVAGLMLSRGAARQREYALRSALGAGTGRLMAQVTMESLVLAVAGCVLGVLMTYGGVRLVQSLGPDHLPRIDEVRVDRTVLLFAVAVAGLSAFLSGLAPSLRLSRPDLRGVLTENSRGATPGRSSRRLRNWLVVAEVAAAVVLLIGAGLLFRSFALLIDKDLGFDPTGRVAVQVFAYGYEDGQARANFVNTSIENMEAIPGMRRVALTSSLPAANDGTIASIDIDVPFTIDGRAPPPQGQEPIVSIAAVSKSYFEVMAIPVVEGRGFDDRDNAQAPPVILINQTLARRHFADRDPLGEKLLVRYGQPVAREIVGVVSDIRPLGHESEPRPEVYFPLTQVGTGSLTFVAQTEPGVTVPASALMEAIWDANPAQSVWGAMSLDSLLGEWLKERRFNLMLLSGFAIIALLLATIGIYGLISYSVEQRTGELGIRRALGGRSGDLLGMVLREGAVLACAGVVLGLIAAMALTRFIQGMLFGIEPVDPITFALLGVGVLVVAALAALLPAVRAMRIDPMVALRNE